MVITLPDTTIFNCFQGRDFNANSIEFPQETDDKFAQIALDILRVLDPDLMKHYSCHTDEEVAASIHSLQNDEELLH